MSGTTGTTGTTGTSGATGPTPAAVAAVGPDREGASAAPATAGGVEPEAGERERLARAALSRVGEPGDPRLTRLVTEFGGVTVHRQLLLELDQQGCTADLRSDVAARRDQVDAAGELERAARLGLRFVVPGDVEWPDGLDDLAHGLLLHARGGVPVGLWVRGPRPLAPTVASSVAVVGSRSATSYGSAVAGEVAAGVAGEGWAVVSGAAFGIDQAAHRAALAVRGPTVAVLACGADRAYPSAHRQLIDYVADTGVVVSEAAPGGAPTRIRFLARNRLIAAMTVGTVVVEAAVRSGALNTASWAGGLGRVLMGVPGPVTSAPSVGVHQLIRGRGALLVTGALEVLEAVSPMGQRVLEEPREADTPRDRLTDTQRQVLDGVPLVRAAEPDRIARAAGVRGVVVRATLPELRAAGLVEERAGRWRVCVVRPAEQGRNATGT